MPTSDKTSNKLLYQLKEDLTDTLRAARKQLLEAQHQAVTDKISQITSRLETIPLGIKAQEQHYNTCISQGAGANEQRMVERKAQIASDRALIPKLKTQKNDFTTLQTSLKSALAAHDAYEAAQPAFLAKKAKNADEATTTITEKQTAASLAMQKNKAFDDEFASAQKAFNRLVNQTEFSYIKQGAVVVGAQARLTAIHMLSLMVGAQSSLHHYRYYGWGDTANDMPAEGPTTAETEALAQALLGASEALTTALEAFNNAPAAKTDADEKQIHRRGWVLAALVPASLVLVPLITAKLTKGDINAVIIAVAVTFIASIFLGAAAFNRIQKYGDRNAFVKGINHARTTAVTHAGLYKGTQDRLSAGALQTAPANNASVV